MRYVVVGLGAIGGSVAARLLLAGFDVTGVARGDHLRAVRDSGLLVRSPSGDVRCALPVEETLAAARPTADDVVVVATKSQHTADVLRLLPGPDVPVVLAQNGIANEPEALRWSAHVHAMVVMSPCVHLEPGVVEQYAEDPFGVLDVGGYPEGQTDVSRTLAAALRESGYASSSLPDITRWKVAKLITNLGNAVEAVCGPEVRGGPLTRMLEDEAYAVLEAAGLPCATPEESGAQGGRLHRGRIDGRSRPGGSVWQSARTGRATEVDYLNGEIVRLGRLHGRPAPANALLQRLTHEITAGRRPVAGVSEDAVVAMLSGDAGRPD